MTTMNFLKPENALSRAKEFLTIDNKGEAMKTLHWAVTSKKWRVWSPPFEEIVSLYLDLCIDGKHYMNLKDVLQQYKTICEPYEIHSLEKLTKEFVKKAKEKVEANVKIGESTAIEDLESETNELESSTASLTEEKAKQSWLKFLWEIYRNLLDVLRNHKKLELFYAEIAIQAFQFCKNYKRRSEFRRLVNVLSTHLENFSKHANRIHALNLQESFHVHVDIRFNQFNTAVEFDLWPEAFKTLEDVHILIKESKKSPKPQMLATFYQKASQLFLASQELLYHAYCVNKHFNLSRIFNKSISEDELSGLATSSLLAIMSIPLETSSTQLLEHDEIVKNKQKRIDLLSFSGQPAEPNRKALIEEITKKEFLALVHPELRDFHELMEIKFNPLQFSATLKKKLEFISSNSQYKDYVKPLEYLMFIRLLQQLARVFETMKLSEFHKLAFFINPIEAEKQIVKIVNSGYVHVRIDYQNGILNFRNTDLETEQYRTQFSQLASKLQQAAGMINPDLLPENINKQKKKEVYSRILKNLNEEHYKVLARKKYIEDQKFMIEERIRLKEEKKEQEKLEKEKQELEEKRKRMAEEEAKKAALQKEKEEKERKRKEFETFIDLLKKKGETVPENLDEIDPDVFMKQREQKKEEEQKERVKKLQVNAIKMDYLERARREEERTLIEQYYVTQKKEDEEYFNNQKVVDAKEHEEKFKFQNEEKKRLKRIEEDKVAFVKLLVEEREAAYQQAKKDREQRIADKRKEMKEKHDAWAKKEGERKAELERQNKIKAEEEEKKRKEKEEQDRKNKEIAEKQRKREEEVMAKQKQREEEERPKDDSRKKDEDKGRWGRDEPQEKSGRWRKDEEGGRREEREEGGGRWRKDGEGGRPPREERSREDREEGGGRWRKDDREGGRPPREDREGGRPPREERSREDREEGGGRWRRDDREGGRPPREERPREDREEGGGGKWRKDDREGGRPPREDREGGRPPREERPREEREEGGGGRWRKDDREGGRPPREDREGGRPPREYREGGRPPREDREGGRPPREDREEGGNWRREDREGGRGGREDREGGRPPREDREEGGGGKWRKDDRPREDRPPREDREGGRPPREEREEGGGGKWRRDDRPREDRPPREDREGGRPPREDKPREEREEGGGGRWRREEGGRGGRDDREGGRGGREGGRGERSDSWRKDKPSDDDWQTAKKKK